MATAKLETAADRYRRIKAEKEAKETLYDVTCEGTDDSCGMTWKARRMSKDFWVKSGILPTGLAEIMLEAANAGTSPDKILKKLAAKEVAQSVEFSSKVVRKTAAEPRIVETATKPDEVSYEDVMTCCYDRLLNWQMKGGDEAARLGNFPKK